ncbi:MAG: Asp-tRNA(Asn)/Glu-tRNA(Gln) amidotransferase subunit GatC [Gammaproteobacteria bacterium]|nr:Asp-tRNA(Asn)/Glu-tRNA(Gln) amidotransferase subunit GatC [Gammaproteobacteria bacterium]
MSIDAADIEGIARLARIRIEPADITRHAAELSRILTYVDQMNEIDTTGVDPLAHAIDAVATLRADVVTEVVDRDLLQAGAPRVEGGYYLVPRVIE